VLVQGKLATREYEKDGVKRYSTEIVVGSDGDIQILSPRSAESVKPPQ
jgi:single-strand DNA-binding protein